MTSAHNPTSYLSSIHHDGSKRYVLSSNGIDLHVGDEVIVRLRAAANAPIERILLRTCPDGEQFFAEMRIEESQSSTACTWWPAKLRRTSPALIDGGFQVLLAEENILAYLLRELFTGKISTVINGNLPLPALSAGVQIWRTVS